MQIKQYVKDSRAASRLIIKTLSFDNHGKFKIIKCVAFSPFMPLLVFFFVFLMPQDRAQLIKVAKEQRMHTNQAKEFQIISR